ncbi:hypothetical protein BC826DRAFT_972020 [Russula brevipes]|nr:hypothetical protein BC826DRAFT_972020 [Russula brevipes]
MTSTNPSSTRLSRSTSELSGVKHQKRPGASSSRVARDGGKDTLPQAKIQALEEFVKFGRKGKQKEQETGNSKAPEFPPHSRSPTSTGGTDPAAVTAARAHRSPPPPSRAPPQQPSRAAPTVDSKLHGNGTTPEIALSASRRVTAKTGVDCSHAMGIPPEISVSPPLERRGSLFPETGALDGEGAAPPEPLTLARRIQTLLGSRASPQAPTPSATDATTSSGAAQSETAGPATPGGSIPGGPAPTTDSGLLALLGNVNVMSGSLDKGRQSVFAILDRLRKPSARATEAPVDSAPSSVSGEEQDAEDDEGDSSIMLYGPLVPSEDSEVELAASDIMSVFDDGETLEFEQPARPLSFFEAGEQLTPRSPTLELSQEFTRSAQQEALADASQADTKDGPGAVGWFDTWKGKWSRAGNSFRTRSRRAPSRGGTKWSTVGNYLPPPVLDVLNNSRLETAKRAAIITTALQWLLGQVPMTLIPPQFRIGLLIAQRIVPSLGYIGGFVAWSWGAMKTFDKGHGIVLTATWLLPIAPIPGSWELNVTFKFGVTITIVS